MISIQTRDITDELASLVKRIDSLVDDPADSAKTKKAFVVVITDDPEEARPRLVQLAEKLELKNTPLTIFDGVRGPLGYQIARKAEVTVVSNHRQSRWLEEGPKMGPCWCIVPILPCNHRPIRRPSELQSLMVRSSPLHPCRGVGFTV